MKDDGKVTQISERRRYPRPNEVSTRKEDRTDGTDPYSLWMPQPSRQDGEAAKIQTWIDRDTYATIEELISTKVFRWGTSSDFLRWAIAVGVARAGEIAKDPEINNAVATRAAITQMLQLRRKMGDLEEMLKSTKDLLSGLLKRGAHKQVKAEIGRLRPRIVALSDSFWKKNCLEMLFEFEELASAEERGRVVSKSRLDRMKEREEHERRAKRDKDKGGRKKRR